MSVGILGRAGQFYLVDVSDDYPLRVEWSHHGFKSGRSGR